MLIGGGHSHVQFLKSWAVDPMPGVELCMASDVINTPYSGMLPGRLAGWYRDRDMHFNLANLCAQAGATFIHDAVIGLQSSALTAHLAGYPPLIFDVCSINVGISPVLPPGAAGNPRVIPVKPISQMLRQWHGLMDELEEDKGQPWFVVGGGAAGFEISLALAMAACRGNRKFDLHLLEAGPDILASHSAAVRRRALQVLNRWGVKVRTNCAVKKVQVQIAQLSSGEETFERMLVTTGGEAPGWFKNSDLKLNGRGFLEIDRYLQSVPGRVFAAGDCAHFSARPLSKSGVFAVRQGPVLAENLRRAAVREKSLVPYKPQSKTLSLLISGEHRALLSYGPLAFEGAWAWRWKDKIDRRFMEMFGGKPAAMENMTSNTCGGCGGKASAQTVSSVVRALSLPEKFEDVGYLGPTAVTVDGFRTFTPDLHLFGRVAVLHAFNDMFASGAMPAGVTVMATLPAAKEPLRGNQLLHMMKGVMLALEEHQTKLLNAHTAEGGEASLSITCLGEAGRRWSKHGLAAGQNLILTKPLGTGALLQGWMQGRLAEDSLLALKESLLTSHGAWLAKCAAPVAACTDVSGFGLIGHLSEMMGSAQGTSLSVELDSHSIMSLPNFSGLELAGVAAFLTGQNRAAYSNWVDGEGVLKFASLFYDPQTNGPLLIAVAAKDSDALLEELRAGGFTMARVIGRVQSSPAGRIILR